MRNKTALENSNVPRLPGTRGGKSPNDQMIHICKEHNLV